MAAYERFSEKQRLTIFMCILVCCTCASVLNTVLNTVIPPIMTEFSVSSSTAQWLASGYSMIMAISLPLSAYMITRFPTKPLYLAMVALFVAGLALTGFATNFPMMMLGRAIQAVGNGFLASVSQTCIFTVFPPERRGTVMGWHGLAISGAPIFAPTLGGLIADLASWRWIFYIFACVMTIIFIVGAIAFENVLETRKKSFDTISFVLSALALGGITTGIGSLSSQGMFSPIVLICLAIGAIAMVVFCKRQMSMDDPLLDITVLKQRKFRFATIASFMIYFITMGASILVPLYAQETAGQTAAISGLILLPGSLCTALLSPIAGKLFDKHGLSKIFAFGCILATISNVGMMFIDLGTASLALTCILNALRCVALTFLTMPINTWGMNSLKESETAHGVAIITALRNIGGAIGTAVCVGVASQAPILMGIASGTQAAGVAGTNAAFGLLAVITIVMAIMGKTAMKKEAAR